MADFAELLATAVGDAHDRAELAASRPKRSADRLRSAALGGDDDLLTENTT
jgi:hypothetical protein